MYNKHNSNMDKPPFFPEIIEPMVKDTFLVMPTNEEWRTQRKAVSHMFFK